jgi:hypothetical protein
VQVAPVEFGKHLGPALRVENIQQNEPFPDIGHEITSNLAALIEQQVPWPCQGSMTLRQGGVIRWVVAHPG